MMIVIWFKSEVGGLLICDHDIALLSTINQSLALEIKS